MLLTVSATSGYVSQLVILDSVYQHVVLPLRVSHLLQHEEIAVDVEDSKAVDFILDQGALHHS